MDEADEMLNMGFIDDIETILSEIPKERQTLLFSATMPDPIRRIAERYMQSPEVVRVAAKEMTALLIEQFYVKVQEKEKFEALVRLLDVQAPKLSIIFGRTKRRVDEVSRALDMRGFNAEGIHGDLTQAKRLSVLRKFKEGKIDILVATDVAARGLDISNVSHVYNFDIPQDPESYVHRIGRTGRAGKEGMAVTFVSPRELGYLRIVEQTTKKRMTPLEPPTEDQAFSSQLTQSVEQVMDKVRKGNLESYVTSARDLLESVSAEDAVAAMLALVTKTPDQTPVHITEERPLPNRGGGGNRGSKGGGGYKGKRTSSSGKGGGYKGNGGSRRSSGGGASSDRKEGGARRERPAGNGGSRRSSGERSSFKK